jgi:hypothetical protein
MPNVKPKKRSHAVAYTILAIFFVPSAIYWVRNTSVSIN